MLSAYHRLCTTYPSHNEEKRQAYLARARECRAQAMAAREFRTRLERVARGAERRRESREFRAQHLANIAMSHHVPNTKLGRRLLLLFHPLLTTDGQLVWRELWTRGAYHGTPLGALSISHSPWS